MKDIFHFFTTSPQHHAFEKNEKYLSFILPQSITKSMVTLKKTTHIMLFMWIMLICQASMNTKESTFTSSEETMDDIDRIKVNFVLLNPPKTSNHDDKDTSSKHTDKGGRLLSTGKSETNIHPNTENTGPTSFASNSRYFIDLEEIIGEGGFAKVYEGTDTKDEGKKVAIKKIPMITGHRDEINIMKKLADLPGDPHRNILAFKDVIDEDGFTYLITELCSKRTLHEKIEESTDGKFDEETARFYMRQIIEGVLLLHENQIVHRDLKLANILLTNDSDALLKIIDFGHAYDLKKHKEEPTGGTVDNMAPETWRNEKCTTKVDVWSMGIILYNMLTGKLLFELSEKKTFSRDDVQKILQKMKTIEFLAFASNKWPDSLSKSAAKDLIKRMLTFNPQDRIDSEDLLCHKWFTQSKII
jgi:hypothetical protein